MPDIDVNALMEALTDGGKKPLLDREREQPDVQSAWQKASSIGALPPEVMGPGGTRDLDAHPEGPHDPLGLVPAVAGHMSQQAIAVPAGLMRLVTKSAGNSELLSKIEPTLEEMHTLDRMKELFNDVPESTGMAGSKSKPGTPGFSNDMSLQRQQSGGGMSGRMTDARRVAQIAAGGPKYLHPDDPLMLNKRQLVNELNRTVDSHLVPEGFKPQPIGGEYGGSVRVLKGDEATAYKPVVDAGISEVSLDKRGIGKGAPSKFTEDQIRQARNWANGEASHLPVNKDLIAQVKSKFGITASDQDVRTMLRGETFFKVGGKLRDDR